MFDFFCSFDGCSMSMSYRVWPSTVATRSSSACVALMSILFIVRSSRAVARGTPWAFASGYRYASRVRRAARVALRCIPALRHHGTPRERLYCFSKFAGRRPRGGGAFRVARVVVQRRCLTHRAMEGPADVPLTWPPRGRWSRTTSGIVGVGLSAPRACWRNLPRNQTLTSRGECSRSKATMDPTDPPRSKTDSSKPDASKPDASARTVRIPEDREGQRLDNFLLGQLKGAPRSLVYKLVRSGQVRVNGGRAKAERKLEPGDEVRIPPVRLGDPAERGAPAKGLLEAMEASIVFEDARLLVINKPSGVASHGGSGITFGAIETMRALRPKESLELVHRLDRDTSG